MTFSIEMIKGQLRDVGLKATPSRIAVFELLHTATKPMNAQTILDTLGGKEAPVQATIYRILNSLVQAELVQELNITKGVSSYEIANRPHHHHLICEKCGLVDDVKAGCDNLKPKSASFNEVTNHNLEYSGICNDCAN